MTSPGVSKWTLNENSLATQTTQTENYWGNTRDDSFDSTKSYSMGSRFSTLSKHHRSRSVETMKCSICKKSHLTPILRPSESMNYAPRVTFQESRQKIRGSLPDLRCECHCRRYGNRNSLYRIHGDSAGSTDSLLEEADEYMRRSNDQNVFQEFTSSKSTTNRRCSENDIPKDYIPSKTALPFLPKTAKCLKIGHLAKVISKNGRVVIGRVRYIGPLANNFEDETFIGLQLPNNLGDCDGTVEGRRFFNW